MSPTRRAFLETGAAALVSAGLSAAPAHSDADAQNNNQPARRCLDYGQSFILGTASFNNVRFQVESRTTISDDATGVSTTYYQCASCKSEDTFAEKNLFYPDNYDFLPILGDGEWLIFRRPARISETYRRVQKVEDVWGPPDFKLREAAQVTALETWEQIRDATAQGLPIVTQTEIANAETGLRAVIECPTKTMNISLDRRMYQVDTGPVAFPDLSRRFDPPIDCLNLAFIAFNAPHFADFVIEQPTPVVEEEQDKCRIYHYSSPISVSARNILLALG
jgi:hypothetical protein